MSSPAIEIPAGLAANWRDWFSADAAAEIAVDIRGRFAAAVEAWSLTDVLSLPGGNVALVLGVRCARGEAVLKLSPRPPGVSFAGEGAALARWTRAGIAPAVWGRRDDGNTLLLARVRPGQTLRDAGAGAEEILETIGGLCPRIHLDVNPGEFPSLAEHAHADGWPGQLGGPRERDELTALLAPGPGHRLLHIDLHWLNVLRGTTGWLVIDPKPCLGDPHAEVFAFFDGPPLTDLSEHRPRAREQLWRRLERYAAASGLDRDRLAAWVRIRGLICLGEPNGVMSIKEEQIARLLDALG